MLTSDPVILFSPDGRRSKRFAAIDAPGWIRAGWSLVPIEKSLKKDLGISSNSEFPSSDLEKSNASPEIAPSLTDLENPESLPSKASPTKKK